RPPLRLPPAGAPPDSGTAPPPAPAARVRPAAWERAPPPRSPTAQNVPASLPATSFQLASAVRTAAHPSPSDRTTVPRSPTATTVDGGRTARPYSALFVGESTACHDVPPSDGSSTT